MATLNYTFTFISLVDSCDLNISFNGDFEEFEGLINTLKYGIFGRYDVSDGVAYFMRSSEILYANCENLVNHLSYINSPQLRALPAWIKKVGFDNFFTVVTNRTVPQHESFAIRAKIEELQFGIPFEQTMEQIHELTCSIYSNYSVIAYDGHKRVYIGPSLKENRRCRYCHRTQDDGATFKKIGHTISEGLGNKAIITNDECDECNEYFGQNIEPHFIRFIDPLRVLFGVHGKEHKITKIKGDNFEMELLPDTPKTFNIKIFEEPKGDSHEKFLSISLKHNTDIIPQNLYKCLVKYAYGIIPEDLLDRFESTSNWLIGKSEHLNLPLIRIAYINGYEPEPRIVVYIKSNDDVTLPYAIGEFHVLNMIYVYIIPIFTDDESKYCNPDGWQKVLEILKHWNSLNWVWKNFSSLEPIQPIMNFNFSKRNS